VTPPDLIHTWGGGHLDALRTAGFARNLTEDFSGDWALEFRPAALQNYMFDGQIYGVPTFMSLISLWVNESVFEEAGVSSDRLDSWEGFLQTVADLKAQGVNPIAVSAPDRWTFGAYWENLALGIGGPTAFNEAYQSPDGSFEESVFIEAGNQFARLAALDPFQDTYPTDTEDQAVVRFANGEAALILTGNWRVDKMRWHWRGGQRRMREELSRRSFPDIDQGYGAEFTYGGVDGFAVNASSPPEAIDLLRFITGREVQDGVMKLSSAIPTTSGSEIALSDPFRIGIASELLKSRYHQLYLSHLLGPRGASKLTEVALEIGRREMTGREAAAELESTWSILRQSGELPETPDWLAIE
jgi:raffinose/stachyose/melibiose transport system substrate-binding protein